MSGALTAIVQLHSVCSPPRTKSGTHRRPSLVPCDHLFQSGSHKSRNINLSCRSSSSSTDSGNNDSTTVLDAFLLGKAVAEAVNERIESSVGEFLSTIGRLQAEQHKQVQDFQKEVLEKVRRTKQQAAREAMEAQGQVPKSTSADILTVNGFTTSVTPNGSSSASKTNRDDPLWGMLND